MRDTHLRAAIVMGLLSIYCIVWFIPNNTEPPQSELDLAPSLMPTIAAVTILITAFALFVQAWRAPKSTGTDDDDEFGVEATGANLEVLVNFLLWCVSSAIAWLVMAYVGFEPAMTIFLAATMYFVGVRNHVVLWSVALLSPFVISRIAWYLFTTELPGIWRG
ncbi:MAG: tripartite tricarboxylate transporter TctB family protein [Pseudomonadota bacterium]